MKAPADGMDTSHENGGIGYDEFQLAIIQGLAQVEDVTGEPLTWALFQYSKNLDTHKDNLRRKMLELATSDERPEHVTIDRSMYIPNTTMREMVFLNLNPGGVSAEAETADQGLDPHSSRTHKRTKSGDTEIRTGSLEVKTKLVYVGGSGRINGIRYGRPPRQGRGPRLPYARSQEDEKAMKDNEEAQWGLCALLDLYSLEQCQH